jgi:hypothetical protein
MHNANSIHLHPGTSLYQDLSRKASWNALTIQFRILGSVGAEDEPTMTVAWLGTLCTRHAPVLPSPCALGRGLLKLLG